MSNVIFEDAVNYFFRPIFEKKIYFLESEKKEVHFAWVTKSRFHRQRYTTGHSEDVKNARAGQDLKKLGVRRFHYIFLISVRMCKHRKPKKVKRIIIELFQNKLLSRRPFLSCWSAQMTDSSKPRTIKTKPPARLKRPIGNGLGVLKFSVSRKMLYAKTHIMGVSQIFQ